MRVINYFKNDFGKTKDAWQFILNREIPNGVYIPMYIVMGILVLPLTPFVLLFVLYSKIRINMLLKKGLWSLISFFSFSLAEITHLIMKDK